MNISAKTQFVIHRNDATKKISKSLKGYNI